MITHTALKGERLYVITEDGARVTLTVCEVPALIEDPGGFYRLGAPAALSAQHFSTLEHARELAAFSYQVPQEAWRTEA